MGWSDEHRGFVVETFFKNNESVIATQRAFRRHFRFGRRAPVPDRKTILLWVSNMRATRVNIKTKTTWPTSEGENAWKLSDGEVINRATSKAFRKETRRCPWDFRSKCEKNSAPGTRNHPYKMMVAQEFSILREMFPGHLISLRGDIGWPARSSDLTPCDFFSLGIPKS